MTTKKPWDDERAWRMCILPLIEERLVDDGWEPSDLTIVATSLEGPIGQRIAEGFERRDGTTRDEKANLLVSVAHRDEAKKAATQALALIDPHCCDEAVLLDVPDCVPVVCICDESIEVRWIQLTWVCEHTNAHGHSGFDLETVLNAIKGVP